MTMHSAKIASIFLICFTSGAANAADSVDFEEHILPLFYQRCFSCHSEKEEKPKGGLKLDSVKTIRESGVIVRASCDLNNSEEVLLAHSERKSSIPRSRVSHFPLEVSNAPSPASRREI
ncbi:MAG: hypothetical protein ACI8UO_002994 [Verrucomicrobiales bacterium]|jgi:hypothetical protein